MNSNKKFQTLYKTYVAFLKFIKIKKSKLIQNFDLIVHVTKNLLFKIFFGNVKIKSSKQHL